MDEHVTQLNRNVKVVFDKNERMEEKLNSILQLLERDQRVSGIRTTMMEEQVTTHSSPPK
jgi:acyl-[acyl carrier protein]--UDP-N-acetylglucosamine O-acyltransferase